MADRSSASTTELEARDRAIVERVAAGLSLRAVGAECGCSEAGRQKTTLTAVRSARAACTAKTPPVFAGGACHSLG
jgi:hypothetical protein